MFGGAGGLPMGTVVRWQLELGGEVISRIDADDYEFPWTYGRLVDSPGFDRFRVFFGNPDDWPETPEFEALCREITAKGDFALREVPAAAVYRSVTLRQEGEVVWFRYGEAADPGAASDRGGK
jgi:hypothetical protein